MHDDHPLTSWFEQAIARLPVAFREGKKPYVFFFVSLMVTTLLLYVAISPYQNASLMLLLMAVFLTGLLVLINYGRS